ncbi:MAG: hypothetical protein JWN30_1644, partial [Bacilli bacterium]|nr:hypothetical protein [Bacilli bacterium]
LDSSTQTLGSAQVFNGNFYALGHVNFINNLVDDYSYGMNSTGAVPFAQIAVHGLVNYSSRYANNRDDYNKEFLRSIEYGSEPVYMITSESTRKLMLTGINGFSTTFSDWESTMVKDYQRYNQALGDVQDKFIVGHQELAAGVEETIYSNGKQIVVNYNKAPYKLGTVTVPAEDFAVIPGGGSK